MPPPVEISTGRRSPIRPGKGGVEGEMDRGDYITCCLSCVVSMSSDVDVAI
jgi:hypothetical protein